MKLTLICILLLSGCASVPICTKIELPDRPNLIATPDTLWQTVPLEAQDIWANNDLSLKAYAKKLEGRIKIFNETCNQ